MKSLATDVVIVGGGAAGLLAAVAARRAGLETIVVESTSQVGGSTGADTGQLWLPASHLAGKTGGSDTPEAALTYLNEVLGAETASSTKQRREALASTGTELSQWLEANGVILTAARGRPDFYQDASESRRSGRLLAGTSFDRRVLGPLAGKVRETDYDLEIAPRSVRGLVTAARELAVQALNPTKDLVFGGAGLVAQLLHRATVLGASVWVDTPMTDLVSEDGRVVGVLILRDGAEVELRAGSAVMLCCGGFEGSQAMRREYLPLPTDVAWSSGLSSNVGDGIRAAASLGEPLVDMAEAWWTVVSVFNGKTYRMTNERAQPHGIIVDQVGDRFVNEAGPAVSVARQIYERNRGVRAVPSYLIVDNRHRQRYRLGPWLPGSAPAADDGAIIRAQSLADLADELSIDKAGLIGTVVRFNAFAAKGNDGDFKRGASASDRAYGDPIKRKNACLGTLERSPFWAVPVFPGDSGTKGGVLIDASGRVLGADRTPIAGLYAVTGTAASLFKGTAPGPGAALGAALVEAYRAVQHLVAHESSA